LSLSSSLTYRSCLSFRRDPLRSLARRIVSPIVGRGAASRSVSSPESSSPEISSPERSLIAQNRPPGRETHAAIPSTMPATGDRRREEARRLALGGRSDPRDAGHQKWS
jgi:hypothetical protein